MKAFEDFKNVCEKFAKELHCGFYAKNYSEYGWFYGAFEVDRFGGIAAIIKFFGGKWYNDERAFDSLEAALESVPGQVAAMAEARKNVEMFNCD